MPIIQVENLTFAYNNKTILKNASFSVEKGDFISILGANGAGKSTLLKLMLSLLQPNSGTIKIDGYSPKTAISTGKMAYVSQRATAFNTAFPATAEEIVSLGITKNIQYKTADKQRVEHALRQVEMQKYANRLIGSLSGGQQQRIFIARALVCSPDIIFLDEPTTGIDIDTVGSICCLLGELNKLAGITILMVTHDLSSVISHSNKILNIKQTGEIELLPTNEYKKTYHHLPNTLSIKQKD